MTPSQTSGVDALARPTKVVEGLSAMPMMSVQSAPMASASRTFFARPKVNRVMPSSICLQAVAALVDVQLGRDVPVLDDGARDELGEHDDISAEINDVVLRFYIPAVDVDGVGKGLEGIEADAQRQDADALNGRKTGAQQALMLLSTKFAYLK